MAGGGGYYDQGYYGDNYYGDDYGRKVGIHNVKFEDEGRSLEARAHVAGLNKHRSVRFEIDATAKVRVRCGYGEGYSDYGYGYGWDSYDYYDTWKGDDHDHDWLDDDSYLYEDDWYDSCPGHYEGLYDGYDYGYSWSHLNRRKRNRTVYVDLEGDRYYSRSFVRRNHGNFWFRVETENERRDIQLALDYACGYGYGAVKSVRFEDAKIKVIQRGRVVQALLCDFDYPTSNGWIDRRDFRCHELYNYGRGYGFGYDYDYDDNYYDWY